MFLLLNHSKQWFWRVESSLFLFFKPWNSVNPSEWILRKMISPKYLILWFLLLLCMSLHRALFSKEINAPVLEGSASRLSQSSGWIVTLLSCKAEEPFLQAQWSALLSSQPGILQSHVLNPLLPSPLSHPLTGCGLEEKTANSCQRGEIIFQNELLIL